MRQQCDIVNLRRRERGWLPALFRNERQRAGERLGVEANADERNAGATCGTYDRRILALRHDQRVDAHRYQKSPEGRFVQFGIQRRAYRIRADGKHRYGAFGTGRQGDPDPRSATISGLRKRARGRVELPAEIHVCQRIAVWREDRGRSGKCVDRGREQIA